MDAVCKQYICQAYNRNLSVTYHDISYIKCPNGYLLVYMDRWGEVYEHNSSGLSKCNADTSTQDMLRDRFDTSPSCKSLQTLLQVHTVS